MKSGCAQPIRRGRLFALAIGLVIISASGPARADNDSARLALDVLLVNDPDFPPVTAEQAATILREAKATMADKLAFQHLEFRVKGSTDVAGFLNRHAPLGVRSTCADQFAPHRVRPDGRMPRDIPKSVVEKFLKRWTVEALVAFFPEELRAGLESYDDIYEAVMKEFSRKLALIAGFKLANGKSLLDPTTIDQRSYVRWICAMRVQDDADIILTNAFILYDLGSEPYPHSIFAKNKVGGASLHSSTRTAIYNRALFASTFSMVTDLPFFKEEGVETLSDAERLSVIGTFIVAHELGHAVFKLPDFYDHPRECLMTTKYETGYVVGYRNLKKYPGSCPMCQPYVDAKRHVFRARTISDAGQTEAAIGELKQAIRKTPKHVDGSYLRYMANLSVQVAGLYASMGETKKAKSWLKSALRIVPKHTGALALKEKIDNPKTVWPASRTIDAGGLGKQ